MIRRRRTGANLDARTTTATRCRVPTPSPRVATGGGAEDVSGPPGGGNSICVRASSGPPLGTVGSFLALAPKHLSDPGGLSHPWDTCDASCQLYCPTWGVRRDPRLLAPGDRRYSSRSASTVVDGRIPDFPVTRSHPPASWPSAANSSICRTYRKTAGEESRRRSPVANRWMRP